MAADPSPLRSPAGRLNRGADRLPVTGALGAPLHEMPGAPVPPGAVSGYLTAADGVRLRFARWPASPGVPRKGTIALLLGRDGYQEKYFETVRDLQARGFAVASLDWRGQGGSDRLLSDPRRGHVGDFREYQMDLKVFAREVLLPDCPAPHFALAHSMGCVILLDAILAGHKWFDRVVLSSPMLALQLGGAASGVQRMIAALAALGFRGVQIPTAGLPHYSHPTFETNRLTTDPVRYARIMALQAAHPELPIGPPTFGWINAAFRAMGRLAAPEVVREIRQPLLIIGAGADKVVSNRVIEHFAARLIAGSAVFIPSAKHEILLETDPIRAQFWAAFDAFIPGSDPLYATTAQA